MLLRAFALYLLLYSMACTHVKSVSSLAEAFDQKNQAQVLEMEPELVKAMLKAPNKVPILVEFGAEWCKPCRELDGPLQDLAKESDGRYKVVRVDVDNRMEVLNDFALGDSIPAILVQAPGMQESIRIHGTERFQDVQTWLQTEQRPYSSGLNYESDDASQTYKAVLIAGSAENANFAQEIFWNQRLLVEKGLKASDIACFYARPDPIQYFADQVQFEKLKAFLASCRMASREEILKTIQRSTRQNPDSFYLYITSHGALPRTKDQQEKLPCYSFAPALALDASEQACSRERDLNPGALAAVLMNAPTTKKIVVLQGCYSGGFIAEGGQASELSKLPNITIFTAARSDRPSFGCNSGSLATVYGLSYLTALTGQKGSFEGVDWQAVNKTLQTLVKDKENAMRIRKRSQPQFHFKEGT